MDDAFPAINAEIRELFGNVIAGYSSLLGEKEKDRKGKKGEGGGGGGC